GLPQPGRLFAAQVAARTTRRCPFRSRGTRRSSDRRCRSAGCAGGRRLLFATVKQPQGRLDVLFANAGVPALAPLASITQGPFDKVVHINVKGVLFTVQKALPIFTDGGTYPVRRRGTETSPSATVPRRASQVPSLEQSSRILRAAVRHTAFCGCLTQERG